MKISLTKKETDILRDLMDSKFYQLGDQGMENTPYAKALDKIDHKFVSSWNKKTGMYYLWQLKDRKGEVTQDNIKDKWKK